ncbi:MAG TPA: DUF6498-containing protein [Candidatus Limnocylindria bacterium]|nr:DUF6498-containing protein [Candidatus Limnocylindria bacterium]
MTNGSLARAVGLYRRTATSRSALLLLVANAIPLVGVAFFDWSLLTILVLYWLENGIVGFWNVPRIVMAEGLVAPLGTAGMGATGRAMNRLAVVGRAGLAIFFIFHYGVFWVVHGVFVVALPAFADGFGAGDGTFAFGELEWSYVALAAVALFISHGASFVLNYIGRGEYSTASPSGQMASAYGRVVVLHLTIIFGSMVVAVLGAPIGALLILVGLKTAFDLGLHLREHRNSGPPLPNSAAPA